MPRPAKSVNVISKNLTLEERKLREEKERKLKGTNDKLKPLKYLNKRQKQIFKYILENLEESKILGNLDVFVLNQTAIAIERLESLEKDANNNPELMLRSSYKAARDMYSKDFFRCCNELCLSPQSRAKLSLAAINKPTEKKTLKDILADDEE